MAESNLEHYAGTCAEHGAFVSEFIRIGEFKSIAKGCPQCLAARSARRQAEVALAAEIAAREAVQRDQQRLREAGVPPRFEGKTLENFLVRHEGQRKALAAATQLVRALQGGSPAPNLIFLGRPGTGKSHLCCGVVSALYRTKRVCRIDLPDLIREIRASWRRGAGPSEEAVLHHFGRLDLLIIEEVGTGAGSEDERARVFQVINRRYEAMLPTVVVSNLGLEELKAELGERVIDRLREGDRSLVVFDWESARG